MTVLTGNGSTNALTLLAVDGPGSLYECTAPFRDAMADRCEEMLATTTTGEEFAALMSALSDDWMAAVEWPTHYASLVNRLQRLGRARDARKKGQTLYFWFGPAVAMRTVAAGSGEHPSPK